MPIQSIAENSNAPRKLVRAFYKKTPLLPEVEETPLDELLGRRIAPIDLVAALAGHRGAVVHIGGGSH
jgi:hypothetical protein